MRTTTRVGIIYMCTVFWLELMSTILLYKAMSRSVWFAVLLLVLGMSLASSGEGVPVGCGGFIKADFPVDFTKIKV